MTCGGRAATEDALSLARADGVDVVEVTSLVEYAAGVVLAAIAAGKHVAHMNAELDGTVGLIIWVRASRASWSNSSRTATGPACR